MSDKNLKGNILEATIKAFQKKGLKFTMDDLASLLGISKKTIYTVGKSKIFEGLGDSFQAARYHSLAAVRDELPDTLRVTAEAEDGEIMAVEHTEYPIYGVQFHPESVMTPDGKVMVQNFINIVKK